MTTHEQAEQLYNQIISWDVLTKAAKLKRIEAIEAALNDAYKQGNRDARTEGRGS